MLNGLIRFLIIANTVLGLSILSAISYAKSGYSGGSESSSRDNVYSESPTASLRDDCNSVHDDIQSLEFKTHKLGSIMGKFCELRSMNDCSSTSQQKIIAEFNSHLKDLKKTIEQLKAVAIKNSCEASEKTDPSVTPNPLAP